MIVVTQTGRVVFWGHQLSPAPQLNVPQVSQVLHLLRRNLAPGAAGQILQNNTWNLVMTHEIWILQDTSGYFSPGSCMGQKSVKKLLWNSKHLQTKLQKISSRYFQVLWSALVTMRRKSHPGFRGQWHKTLHLPWVSTGTHIRHLRVMVRLWALNFPMISLIISPRFCNQHSSV